MHELEPRSTRHPDLYDASASSALVSVHLSLAPESIALVSVSAVSSRAKSFNGQYYDAGQRP